MKHLRIDGLGNLRDSEHRVITLRGINLDGANKMPKKPEMTTFSPLTEEYWDGDNVSFVGRPFSLEEAPEHLERIRSWGYNVIRYVYTWEAIEHKGPGVYDDDFIDYTIEVLKMLQKYDFYVVLDPHQDLWGRHSGGSGAPMWTYYACGFDPKGFIDTEAALVQNEWPGGPDKFPKMFWAANYAKLVCGTIFTMFFAGKEFTPKAMINGVNIQDYLQSHMLNAMLHFYRRLLNETDLFEDCILGVETMNEPNSGWVGHVDITKVPEEQQPKIGHIPTVLQSMVLGMGKKATVENYTFGSFGPSKAGTHDVDPEGTRAWINPEEGQRMDKHYGFERADDWKLGECIFAQHGVWDPESNEALKPGYFCKCPESGKDVDEPYFVNNFFVRYWKKFYTTMRDLSKTMFLLCGPPVMAIPPDLKDTEYIDDRVMYCPHFYDGLTLMLKKWNRFWNIDCLGVLRGKYASPILGIKIGEQNVRNCIRDQIDTMRKEGLERMGNIPCFMTETGMPFDMDHRAAYYKTGDYTSQIKALDAISYGLEGAGIHHTYWAYTSVNTHKQGDSWNGEDFSFWSNDKFDSDLNKSRQYKSEGVVDINEKSRGAEAYIRPFPVAVFGDVQEYGFDLSKGVFTLKIEGEKTVDDTQPATEVYIPDYHYPAEDFYINVTSGEYQFDKLTRTLTWYHEPGEQTLEISPIDWPFGSTLRENTCGCNIM